MSRKRIGEALLERGAITTEQLEAALGAQRLSHQRLGATLVHMGAISEVLLAQVLAESAGLATVDLTQLPVDWSAVHLLRTTFCEQHQLFPFAIDGKGTPNKRVMVAMSDPGDQPAIEEIEFTTGLKVAPFVSTLSQISAAILRFYHKVTEPRTDVQTEPSAPAVRLLTPPPGTAPAAPGAPEPLVPPSPPQQRPRRNGRSSVAEDLDFLFGRTEQEDAIEKLEHKFWTLMRVLAKKGLLTREEFLEELEEDR